ncbi:MAG TPA: hypothetical protein VMZ31_05040 [Phycisphaerae bacterium]|nr:hypothetical protein [Phycisphaerae bacterium]
MRCCKRSIAGAAGVIGMLAVGVWAQGITAPKSRTEAKSDTPPTPKKDTKPTAKKDTKAQRRLTPEQARQLEEAQKLLVYATLETRRVNVNLKDKDLESALKQLGEAGKFDVLIDSKLAEMGYDLRDYSVDLKLSKVSLGRLLSAMLNSVPFGELGYKIGPGHIYITSRDKIRQPSSLETKVYTVGRLMHPIPNFYEPPDFDVSVGQGGGGGGGGGGDVFGELDIQADQQETAQSRSDRLLDMIQKSVNDRSDPQTVAVWYADGGAANISYFSGNLVVTQTYVGHKKIERLLDKLGR